MTNPDLSRRLVLERADRIPDGMGGWRIEWTARGVLWAAMRPRTGKETALGDARASVQGWTIHVRGAPAGAPSRPVAGERFREGARLFAIRSVAEAGPRGAFLICIAEEEQAV